MGVISLTRERIVARTKSPLSLLRVRSHLSWKCWKMRGRINLARNSIQFNLTYCFWSKFFYRMRPWLQGNNFIKSIFLDFYVIIRLFIVHTVPISIRTMFSELHLSVNYPYKWFDSNYPVWTGLKLQIVLKRKLTEVLARNIQCIDNKRYRRRDNLSLIKMKF